MNKPILSVMPDYGNGPYLWKLDADKSADCREVGGNIASYECWPDDDFLAPVSKELREDFDDWVSQFEAYAESNRFRWDSFHQRGMALARRLKKQLGNNVIVRYVKPFEDPSHMQDKMVIVE